MVSGFEILPITLLGTIVTMPLLIAAFGGFRFTNTRRILGSAVPFPSSDTLVSGVGFAAVIATTTLAYSFAGISIVLALVLMRAGVLTVAPTVDAIFGRPVHRYSWMAWALSIAAVGVALSQIGTYEVTLAAAANLGLYLFGYGVRLNTMTRHAKVADEAINRRFFAEECIVAMLVLVGIAGLLVLMGAFAETGRTFTTFFANPLTIPALTAGIAYGFLGIFATLIYLDPLENTFAIPVFCCASLLSGIVASLGLKWLYVAPQPSAADFVSSGLIMIAGLCLGARATRRGPTKAGAQAASRPYQFLLFVCRGNTSRSPIAQAICSAEIVRRLVRESGQLDMEGVRVVSAGLAAKVGAPMTRDAQLALNRLGVPVPDFAARNVTPELVRNAIAVVCMTKEQCDCVLELDRQASGKVHRLHPFRDLEDPSGDGPKAFLRFSRQVQYLVAQRLSYFLLEARNA
jgi:protein-tyrosine-phosphatase